MNPWSLQCNASNSFKELGNVIGGFELVERAKALPLPITEFFTI
jgi:hypothetical protein